MNWNSAALLRPCLESIYAHSKGFTFEVIVIDSASFDGCDRMLSEFFPKVSFIQSQENLGFARSNNRAVERANGETLLFLNPDTEIQHNAFYRILARLRENPDAGCIGCRLLNSDGTLQTSCIQSFPTILNQMIDCEYLRSRWPRSSLWGMAALYGSSEDPAEVEAVSGACVMIRRSVFLEVGRFSEDYFMYAEDLDLSHKTRAAGLRNLFIPDATVFHHGGTSTEKTISDFPIVMMREAIWRFLRKTRGRPYAVGYRVAMLVAALCRLTALALVWPVRVARRTAHQQAAPMSKWRAVLRWCAFQHPAVRQFYST